MELSRSIRLVSSWFLASLGLLMITSACQVEDEHSLARPLVDSGSKMVSSRRKHSRTCSAVSFNVHYFLKPSHPATMDPRITRMTPKQMSIIIFFWKKEREKALRVEYRTSMHTGRHADKRQNIDSKSMETERKNRAASADLCSYALLRCLSKGIQYQTGHDQQEKSWDDSGHSQ